MNTETGLAVNDREELIYLLTEAAEFLESKKIRIQTTSTTKSV